MAAPLPDVTLATPAPPPLPSLVNARQLRAQRLGRALRLWVPAGVLILMLAICFLLPLVVTLPSPTKGDIIVNNEPPFSPGHLLGTDVQGVDIFSQLVYGGQVAFEVGVAVTAIGIVDRRHDRGHRRLLRRLGGRGDSRGCSTSCIAFPALVLALVIAEGLGPSEFHVILALSVFAIPALGRVARGATLTIRGLPYMTAARLSGTRSLADHRAPHPAEHHAGHRDVQPARHRRRDHPGGRT